MGNSLVTYEGRSLNTLSNRVMVRVDKAERITASGIIIPKAVDTRKDFRGKVVAVSKMVEDGKIKCNFSLGDSVIMRRNSGVPVSTDDKDNEYRVYKIGEVLYAGF